MFAFSLFPLYLSHDIDGTHQQLIQVSVHHDFRAVHQGILKACPDLFAQLIRHVEFGTEVPQTNTGQVIDL